MEHKRNRRLVLLRCGKRVPALLLCLLILLSELSAAYAAQPASNRTVNAGIFYFDGYHMKSENGRLSGYGIEFLDLVSQYSHLNFSLVGYDRSWGDMLDMLDRGEIDVVTSARKNQEREEKYAFSLPIGRNNTLLSVRADNTDLLTGSYATYDGILIGIVPGSSQNQSLAEFAHEQGFTYQTREYADAGRMAEDLQNGTIDAILSSDLRKAANERTLDIIETGYFYAIVRKEDTELLDEINYAINQMNINEGDWTNNLYYKYYGRGVHEAVSFTERELAYIQDVAAGRRQITVTSMCDRRPYSYVENGELKGILPDYFAQLMELAGLTYETVAPGSRAEYYDIAENSRVDVIIDWRQDQLGSDTMSRSGFYTDTYLNTGVALVTRKDHTGGIATLAVADLLGDIAVEQDLIGNAKVVPCETKEGALQAVLDGTADGTYVYTYMAQSFVNRDTTMSLQYNIVDPLRVDFRMFVRNSCDHELITILNKCIGQTSGDAMSHLITVYTTNSPADVTFGQYMRAHPEVVLISAFLAAAVIGVMIALWLRSRWSKKLLHATEQVNQRLEEQLDIVNTLSRDYINVYAVNTDTATVRAVKIAGYAAAGLEQDSPGEIFYDDLLSDYISYRVLPEDREYLVGALALDNVIERLKSSTEYAGSYQVLVDSSVHTYQFICAAHSPVAGGAGDEDGFFLLGLRNIDELVRREQEQKAVLETALAEAQHANIAKTTFLNNMSHDIRTPMNAIIGFTSLAMSHNDDHEQVEGYLEKILTAGKHLLSLINDILDMSRIESGKVKIEENEASLPEIIHDLKTIVQADVKAKQLSFHVDTLDVTNETIICDKLRLNQVLLNILSNAMKYTGPGGTVSLRIIQMDSPQEGHASYQFRIKDTGIGMSPEFLVHVFEPFEREQTSTVSGIQGTGLGLAITKNIVDIMHGDISVTSQVGVGSEFVVTFQFRVKDETADMTYAEKLEGLRALVVDDDTNTCTSVCRMLSSLGLRPDWTTRGEEAAVRTTFAQEQDDPYRVFLIDWLLPDRNGVETARQLRRIVGANAQIVLLTAYDWTDIEKEAREAGITAFCSKPLFQSELRELLTASFRTVGEEEGPDTSSQLFFGKRILLVEDNELNQEIACTILEEVGLTIDTADDGTEAVEAVKSAPAGTYDLILMDIQMPIMDGYTATRTIRALDDPAKANIPIVAMTANAFEEDRQKAFDAGMNAHVPKPIDIDKLMETLTAVLSEER